MSIEAFTANSTTSLLPVALELKWSIFKKCTNVARPSDKSASINGRHRAPSGGQCWKMLSGDERAQISWTYAALGMA